MARIKWLFPKPAREREFTQNESGYEFNSTLPENDGSVCVEAPPQCTIGENEADDDIRAGRVKKFEGPDEMIASLKKPW